MRLKRWESPRKEGRNDKGRGGSARQRQLKKQRQMLRKRLQEESKADNLNQTKNQNKQKQNKNNQQGGEDFSSPYFLLQLDCFPISPSPRRFYHRYLGELTMTQHSQILHPQEFQ
ncbi:hypothetical protein [Calothrix sp. UHCC 0171]|uniref:hypothetical protein n=1 Tax=Calothrix sp. UHCC 0171 TaxID=3110245 RepID=UPI002B1FFCAD|nr:hypothetical protein [Calothrix sp. UHCC 0171]MEA5570893.1 hypothetical protein [Calothrix sp. UHCC 0171]